MREILFRGKYATERKDLKDLSADWQWAYGDLAESRGKTYIHPKANGFQVNEGDLTKLVVMHEVIPETVGQYTGLTDKNGKQIFDGDILLADGWEKTMVVYDRIGWDSGVGLTGFTSVSIGDWQDWSYGTDYETKERFAVCDRCIDLRNIEVIGNKYDNPELLLAQEDNEDGD